MSDVLFSVEGVRIYTLSAFVFLAFLWSAFVFYKKAIDNHRSESIVFDLILSMGLSAFVFSRIFFVFSKFDWFTNHLVRIFFIKEYPGFNGWGALAGILLALFFAIKRLKDSLFDWLDITVLGVAAGIPLIYAARGLLGYGSLFRDFIYKDLLISIILSLLFFFLWWAENEYRTFGWYRHRKTQAKSGFISGVFISAWAGVNWLLGDLNLRFWYIFLVVLGLVIVYIRSERDVARDLRGVRRGSGLLLTNKYCRWLKSKIKRK